MKTSIPVNWSHHLGLCFSDPWADGDCIGFELFIMIRIDGHHFDWSTHQLAHGTTHLDSQEQFTPFPLREQAARNRLLIGRERRKIRYTAYGSGGNYHWENYTILKRDFPHLLNSLRNHRGLDLDFYDPDFERLIWRKVQHLNLGHVKDFIRHVAREEVKAIARRKQCTVKEILTTNP